MAQKLNKILYLIILFFSANAFAQDEGVKPPKVNNYKSDTSYKNFSDLRFKVAKAQINLLKKNGALLVRLKTNTNTINRLKAAGNSDLATQVERQTAISNKIIMASYLQEFNFCPVYFFYSNYSDSVKHKHINGIFVDSLLNINSLIVCDKSFYLIAEESTVYNSSLGIVSESLAEGSIEHGSPSREAPIVIKNRYFIQLHKPFPFFQLKENDDNPSSPIVNGLNYNLENLYYQINKITRHSADAKQLIKLKYTVRAINKRCEDFYQQNKDFVLPPELAQYVY
jgi:hypothetical protein